MSRTPRSLRCAVLAALAAGALALGSPAGAAASTRARSADDFVESIGVNVHLGYDDTPYGRYDRVKQKLRELGVRYARDGISQGRPGLYAAMRDLASNGIRFDLLIGDPLERYGGGSLEQQLDVVRDELKGAVVSLEGPNEFDNQGYDNWLPSLRDYQRRFYRSVKTDPALRRLTVIGPTLVHEEARQQLGNISGWLDQGNLHSYPGGPQPDTDSQMDEQIQAGRVNSGSKRLQATETGYHNAVDVYAAFPHRPASERAAGVYMPRLYLDYFRRGIARTFAYELIDESNDPGRENSEANFGLLRSNFSEKPAFRSIKRLIGVLQDPGPRFTPGRLRYSIEGASSNVRQVLLQKRDGAFYLALWQPVSVWDSSRIATLRPGSETVRLVLGRTARRVEAFRPSQSGRPSLKRSSVRSLRLPVGPSVTVVKIVTRGGARDEASHKARR